MLGTQQGDNSNAEQHKKHTAILTLKDSDANADSRAQAFLPSPKSATVEGFLILDCECMSDLNDPGNVPCTAHPQTLTRLRCTECETPICPRCMVMYEVGFKCPVCAKKRPNSLEQVQAKHWLAAGLCSVGLGWLYGWLHPVIMSVGLLWFFGLPILAVLVTYALGQQAGSLAHRAAGYKRRRELAKLAFSGAMLGALLASPIQAELWMLWSVISTASNDPAISGTSGTLYVLGQGLRLLGVVAFLRGFRQAFRS